MEIRTLTIWNKDLKDMFGLAEYLDSLLSRKKIAIIDIKTSHMIIEGDKDLLKLIYY